MKPILFSTAMVQAILGGRKTQTRRVVKATILNKIPDEPWKVNLNNGMATFEAQSYMNNMMSGLGGGRIGGFQIKHPYGQPGDVLWVRETWAHTSQLNINSEDENYGYVYKADGQPWEDYEGWKWRPSTHMPREAARLFLRIKAVRVERLQEISEVDALAEGIGRINVPHRNYDLAYRDYLHPGVFFHVPLPSFTSLWQSINGPESWEANPWVWVVEFERISREEAGL